MDEELLQEEDTQKDKYLTFTLGEELYGIDIRVVIEIIGILPITKVPEVPDYVRGIINLRGKIIPVIDIRTAPASSLSRSRRYCSGLSLTGSARCCRYRRGRRWFRQNSRRRATAIYGILASCQTAKSCFYWIGKNFSMWKKKRCLAG